MANSPAHDFDETVPHRSTIVIWLTLTFVLLGAVVVLLLYRSLAMREPQGTIVISGNAAWDTAKAIVTSPSSGHRYETRLDEASRYSPTFFVEPGRYNLLVIREPDARYERALDVARGKPEYVMLPATTHPVPTTSATTAPLPP